MATPTGQLVLLAQRGDQAAIAAIYERFAPRLYRYFLARVEWRTHLAEDLTEDVFVRVLARLGTYRERGAPFSSWLFRIAHNRLVDYLRAQPKASAVDLANCWYLADSRSQQELIAVLLHDQLHNAMRQLPESQRKVIALRYLQDLTSAETAGIVGKAEGAVKKIQARGLKGLRKALNLDDLDVWSHSW